MVRFHASTAEGLIFHCTKKTKNANTQLHARTVAYVF